jgi:hypothetical protein
VFAAVRVFAVLALLGALCLRAADAVPRNVAFEALIADARGLPPEFAADALLRLSTSWRAADPDVRRDLLDEAFERAYAAQEPYRRASTQYVPPDTRQGAQLFAYATSLTRVSLQVRTAELMAFVDPPHARELFEWIDLNVAPSPCEDPLTPAVDEYYAAASLLARRTFDGNRGDALRFLVLYLWQARLPAEMPAVARAMDRFRPEPSEAAYLETVLRSILEAGRPDPRGFSLANIDIVSRIGDLQAADRARGILGWHLLEALRAYLLVYLKGARCSDSVTEALVPATFNGLLRRMRADRDVKPIDGRSVRPSRMLGAARYDWYWQTPDARRLRDAAMQLHGSGPVPVPEKTRQTREWQAEAERLLADIEQWHGTREPAERDFFYQKSVLFSRLIDIAPPSAIRTRALRGFVDFLRHSDIDRDRRPLWFAFVNRLRDMARGNNRREILDALAQSGHPVLSVCAQIDRLAP